MVNVVLGTGPLGLAVAGILLKRGDRVRSVSHSGRSDLPADVERMAADLLDPTAATRACAAADVVYHCASPPYAKWPQLHPPLMHAIIEGASSARAKLIFGDNLYCYGPVDGPINEDLPYRATGPNGRTRARIAEELMDAHNAGRLRAAIGRGSDYFGPRARQSIVGDQVFARALAGKPAQFLSKPDQPHTVTYIEDFARALVTLGDRDEALGRAWHVPNAEAVTLRRFTEMVFTELQRPPRLQVPPSWILRLVAMFNPTLRAVLEQIYQVDRPWIVDSSRFEQQFGWKATPLRDSITATVTWVKESAAASHISR